MTDKTDETGKGPPRSGDAPRRPHATLDLQATEVGPGYSQAGPEPRPRLGAGVEGSGTFAPLLAAPAALAGALAVAWRWIAGLVRSNTWLSHLSAGAAGAALVLAAGALAWLLAGAGGQHGDTDLRGRLAALETALPQRQGLPDDVKARIGALEARLGKVDQRIQATEARLAADADALKARLAAAPDLADRVAKLEAAVAPRAGNDGAARSADVERLAGAADEAKAAAARAERELAALKSEAQGLQQGLDALKGSVEERLKDTAKAGDLAPVLAKLRTYERDLNAVLKTEGERTVSTRQVLLTLELANLKRALDRGDGYARELEAVRRIAAGEIDLAALDRSSRTGVPTLAVLTQEFRRVANAATDAENDTADASVLDRLMAGAKSVVRLRKANYDAGDTSVEATLARMEGALKESRIAEVLEQGRRLPPKAAQAAEDWLRKLEARTAADRAVTEIEAALKASLTAEPGPGAKR
jgi:hypothetical protein